MHSNLLIYRFAILNGLAGALTVALWWSGYLLPLFESDESRLTYAIAGLFVVAWLWSLKEITGASLALNDSKLHGPTPVSEACRDKDFAKIEWLSSVSEWQVALGLLGTVIGFSMALSGIDQGAVSNANGAQSAVTALMQGMRVALNTTLLGAAVALWQEVNMRMLRTALAVYWADRIVAGQQAGAPLNWPASQLSRGCGTRGPGRARIPLNRSNGARLSPGMTAGADQ